MKIPTFANDDPELDVAPLIDMTFLLLVYFMATASLVKSEGDLGIRLPGSIAQEKAVAMPDEQIIEITAAGRVFLNSREFDSPATQELPELYTTLLRFKQATEGTRSEAMVTINAHDQTRHQRVIDVMNACAAAGLTNVTFAGGGGD